MAIKEPIQASRIVETTIKYYLDPSKGGYKDFYPGTVGGYRRKYDHHARKIADVTGHEDDFRLDTNGFSFIKHGMLIEDFSDTEEVKAQLYAEATEVLKRE
jgi:hypothetical protein